MTTQQYIKKYQLNNPIFVNHFNTNLFLEDLDKEFKEKLNLTIKKREESSLEFNFHIFQVIIGEMQAKFSSISLKKAGTPLNKSLWSAFYAKSIIPAREKYFPEEHKAINDRRNKNKK